MITSKANGKLLKLVTKYPNKIQELAVMVVANNVLITDITKKGELVLVHLQKRSNN